MPTPQKPSDVPKSSEESDDEQADADTRDMSTETPQTADNIVQEMNIVLAGDDPLANLKARQVGPHEYAVLSARNGSVTLHNVNLAEGSCSCEDATYNTEGAEVCAHVAKAALVAPTQMDGSEVLHLSAMEHEKRVEKLRTELREGLNVLQRTREANRAAQQSGSDGGETDAETTETTESSMQGPTAEDAAEKLQAAYDDVVDDMQVQAANDYVWVQTGRDTPDTLPGPGNVEVFEAFLQNAEQVTYVHDDHRLASKKPGEWWKNALAPEDVEAYINEVLQ